MPMYRILSNERTLQPFRSIELGAKYHERQLEDWLESNPQVLIGDEPLLIIGRQVTTPVGIMDLLALDADGSSVIVELKRAPSQREAVSQTLEYAAWFSSLDSEAIARIAETHFQRTVPGLALGEAWHKAFNTDLDESGLNRRQRLFLVIEGEDERIVSLVRYLRVSGLDINLVKYNFYRTESGEELLDLERQVGEETPSGGGAAASASKPTEEALLVKWEPQVRRAYSEFRERLVSKGLFPEARRSGMSFNKQTRDGAVFVCFLTASDTDLSVWLRSDSLQTRFDFQSVAKTMQDALPSNVRVNHTPVWFIMTFPASEQRAEEIAGLITREVVDRVQ